MQFNYSPITEGIGLLVSLLKCLPVLYTLLISKKYRLHVGFTLCQYLKERPYIPSTVEKYEPVENYLIPL